MRRIGSVERRSRLAARHHLGSGRQASSPVEVAADLVGIHATDPASVYLGTLARTDAVTPATIERILYEERSLLRVVGMRRTMFVVPVELAGVLAAACSRTYAEQERRRLIAMIATAGISAEPERWVAAVEAETVAALAARGEATATELSRDVAGLRAQIPVGEGRRWQGAIGVSTRLLFLLAIEGRVVRGRPRGSWISSQYRWTPVDRWVPGGLPTWSTEAAQAELVRRWLAAFGPGTIGDLRWWTGWPLRDVLRALAGIDTREVALDGGATGLVLADDVEPAEDPAEPWIALLPALDTTVMGWAERGWYLGEHGPALFDRNGNAGPTVWSDGRAVGAWGQRPSGEIVVRLFEDVGAETHAAIEAAAADLAAWLGQVRIVPRFRTPLEVELGR